MSRVYYIGNIPCVDGDVQHAGILGMKWGVRRYQNADGSLTEEGKRRYGRGLKRDQQKKDKSRSKLIGKRKLSQVSDEELKDRVNRLNLENQYLDAKINHKRKIRELKAKDKKKGESFIKKFLMEKGGDILKSALTTYAKERAKSEPEVRKADNEYRLEVKKMNDQLKREKEERRAREKEERREREAENNAVTENQNDSGTTRIPDDQYMLERSANRDRYRRLGRRRW